MKILDVSAITTTNGLPVKEGSFNLIQDSYREAMVQIIKNLIGSGYSNTNLYIINGLITNDSLSFTSGAVLYNDEIFDVDAFTITGSVTSKLGRIDTTNVTSVEADPVTFTDGVPRNIHLIRKMSFVVAGSGGTLVSLANAIRLDEPQTILAPPTTITFDKPRMYFNSLVASPSASITITLDSTNAINGTEVLYLVQSNGAAYAMTHNLAGGGSIFTSTMGLGGYSNPLTITVNANRYFVVRYRCYIVRNEGVGAPSFGGVSIDVLENT